jgi:hypothetical protein
MDGGEAAARLASPGGRIVAEAAGTSVVSDALGRSLEIRRPGALYRLRLFKAVGPALAQNDRYVGYSMLAMCVVSIDGVPAPQPATEGQIEALVQRLGDAGMVAVGQGLADADQGNGLARPG